MLDILRTEAAQQAAAKTCSMPVACRGPQQGTQVERLSVPKGNGTGKGESLTFELLT